MNFFKTLAKIALPVAGAFFGVPFMAPGLWSSVTGGALGGALGSLLGGDNRGNIIRNSLLSAGGAYLGYGSASAEGGFLRSFGASSSVGTALGAGLGSLAHVHMQTVEARRWNQYAEKIGNESRGRVSESARRRHLERLDNATAERVHSVVAQTGPEIFRPTREMEERNRARGEPVGKDRPRQLQIRDAVERSTENRSRTGGYWSGAVSKEWIALHGRKKKKSAAATYDEAFGQYNRRLKAYGYT
jgi:hypothetical protein